jgi:hypothetical protein
LRAIAQKDPSAFLTGERAQKVDVKIKQLSGSPALADNINLAKKNGSQIAALANARGLRPQLLAAAVLAKMGTSRGDVVQTAQTMADVLGKLRTPIGNELSDEVLLMIAAYDQGASGNFGKLTTTLQGLKAQNNARDIRTIWFLQKNGTITQAEFDFALQFLAVGTIAQKPKDFGVNAEPLTF